jgi:O-antigen/teichoic acid export membrane protein
MTQKTQNWIVRGGWAIADQGLFAFANVLLNMALARWLSPAQYGAFAVAYSVFLFLGALHTALITEPMLVFGAGKYAEQVSTYLAKVIRGHWVLTIAGSLLLGLSALCFALANLTTMSEALFGLALSAPFSLLMWLARRAAYLRFQTRLATFGSAFYTILIAIGLSVLFTLDLVSIFSALLVMGAAGAITGIGMWLELTRTIGDPNRELESRPVIRNHFQYGRWACATSMLMWVPLNLFFVILSATVNLEASAALKALSNLVLPLLQANAALGSLLLPAMVARITSRENLTRLLRICLALFASAAIAYSISVWIFRRPLVHVLYSGQYDSHAAVLAVLLIIPLFDGLMMVLSTTLRAFEMPDRVFWSQLALAIFVLTIGVVAAGKYGLWGAAGSVAIGEVLGSVLLIISVVSKLRSLPLTKHEVEGPLGFQVVQGESQQAGTPAVPVTVPVTVPATALS